MIYPELRNFIVQVRADESADLFDAGVKVMDKYVVPGYMEVFETTITMHPDMAPDDIIGLLLGDLRASLTYLLTIQGISINDEAIQTSQLIELTDALFELPYYEDKDTLLDILNSDTSVTEKLGDLVTLCSTLNVEAVLQFTESVEEGFVENFKANITQIQDQKEDLLGKQESVNNYIKYRTVILKETTNYADKFLVEVSSIGLPFSMYVHQYQKESEIVGDPVNNKVQIATDLVALAMVSGDATANPLLSIRPELNNIYSEINSITIIDIEVVKILQEYNRA